MSAETISATTHALRENVTRFERRRRWKSEGARTLTLAVTVGIGWTIVVPAVLGFALGHWLDARSGQGVLFSAGLGLLGLTLGCYSAWRRIERQ